jgi:hypothetical protein
MTSFLLAKNVQGSGSGLVQNVIARITHGMIGLDFQAQGKNNNKFVCDLLSLQNEEIIAALKSTSTNTNFSKFAPIEEEIICTQGNEIVASVEKAKKMIAEKETDNEKIAAMIEELEEKLAVLYSL